MFNGQFYPAQTIQFNNGNLVPVIGGGLELQLIVSDNGDGSAGGTSSSLLFGTEASASSHTALLITWSASADRTMSSISWDGGSANIITQESVEDTNSGDFLGAAIAIISGARNGTLTCSFNLGTIQGGYATFIGLENLQSMIAEDTAVDTGATGSLSFTGTDEITVSTGGVRLYVGAFEADIAGVSWSGATELSDVDTGSPNYRHSAAYSTTTSGDVTVSQATGDDCVGVGASFR